MEYKHTPGPWKVRGQANVFAGDRPVANCSVVSSNVEWEKYDTENRANAEFIASAPDLAAENERLREALRTLVAWYDTSDDDNNEADDYMRFDSDNDDGELDAIVENARAALAKADG